MKQKMKGTLSAICVGQGGVPKLPVHEAVYVNKIGIEGDSCKNTKYHGGRDHPDQALCLYSEECYGSLALEGISLEPGFLGENLTTKGINYNLLRPGDILSVGDEVTIKITKARQPCTKIGNAYDMRLLKLMWEKGYDHPTNEHFNTQKWGISGFYAQVLTGGAIKPGDTIERIVGDKQPSDNVRNKRS